MKRRSTVLFSVSLVLTAVGLVLTAGSVFAVDPLFVPAGNYGVGDYPLSVFSADLDGDNDNDLAVANGGSNNVSILLNNGDGTFAAPVNYGAGVNPISVFSADFDGDNDNDLAVANVQSYNVSILLNNGDGSFAAAVNYGVGSRPESVFSADLDGDGDYDLALANWISDNVSILLNNGDGTFAAAVNYEAGDRPKSVFSADLDGDNDNDLAVANFGSDNVSILLNNGDSTFAVAVNYAAGSYPFSAFSTDLDGDSDNDLAVTNYYSGNVSILLNNGDGTFAAPVNYGAGNVPHSVFSADLDGDNDNDLAVANWNSDNVSILLNNGDGTFTTAVNYGTGDGPGSVFSADLDGDGDFDLAVANSESNNVSILKNLTIREPIELWVDIVGRNAIRWGETQTYHVYIGNIGYDDAYDVLLMIGIHEEVIIEINLEHPPIDTIDWDSLPIAVLLDDTLSTLPIYLARISPDSIHHFEIKLTVPVGKNQKGPLQLSAFDISVRYAQTEAKACAMAWRAVYQFALETHGMGIEEEYQEVYDFHFNVRLQQYREQAVPLGLIDVGMDIATSLLDLGLITGAISLINLQAACYDWQAYVDECWWRKEYFQKHLKRVRVGYSWDPNDKAGSSGFDTTSHYVPPEQVLNYIVFFENVDSATADAVDIVIVDTVDANLDWSSLTIGEMSHPDVCSAEFDPVEGVITWTCDSIMLPPDTVPPNGEGWLSFSVKPIADLPSGTQISNRASIKFDYNPWIYAPMDSSFIINTIDAEPPSSSVDELADTTSSLAFAVSWSGLDEPAGSGIASYTIYAKIDGGTYVRWISDTTVTSAVYYAETGHTYYFYSIARDNVGHIEDRPQSYDTRTSVISTFSCGDIDGSSSINVADLTYLVDYIFFDGPAPPVIEAANVDGEGGVNVTDLIYLVDYLFFSGPEPICGPIE